MALHPWVGYESLYVARDLNWLPAAVRLRDSKTLEESLAALRSGEADAACMTLDELLRARGAGLPLSAALVLDVSAGADVVLARPGIAGAADLAGKRIGFDPGALGALVFEKLLEAGRLTPQAVTALDLPPDAQLEAWRRNEVDAVVTYEPLATALRREGAREVFDSRQMPDTIVDVLAVRRDRPKVLPAVRALAAAHFRAVAHLRTNEQDAILRISAREGIPPGEVRRMMSGVVLPSLAANRAFLDERPGARLAQVARTLSSLMVRRGLLPREDDLAALVLPGALPEEGP